MLKKILMVILLVASTICLAACAGKEKSSANGDKTDGQGYTVSGDVIANEDYFKWSPTDDTQIVGYTEEGMKQIELVIPKKCTSVQGLEKNTTVKYIKFENDDTVILSTTFSGCTALEKIELPANLPEIDNDVFNGCTSLKEVTIPSGVTKIGSNSFADCTALGKVELSESLKVVGRKAFNDCTSLKLIKFYDAVTDIEKSAFENCSALKEINFGKGLKNIGESAFQKCTALTTVKLPQGVLMLGADAFANCDTLESIYLPASVEKADVSSIVQTHEIKVYVVEGSYMDGRVSELMGTKFYDKQYQ